MESRNRVLSRVFPWMLDLSPEDRVACRQDLAEAVRAGRPRRVLAELRSWRETAAAVAAGVGRGEPEWLDDDDAAVVERP